RLYALIPESTKKAGGEVISLAFRSLTGQAKAAAEHSYYAKPTGFIMPDGGAGAEMKFTAIMSVEAGNENGMRAKTIRGGPTEGLRNGFPGEAVFSLRRTLQEGVF